jgi:predicted DNA-binding transcriptional regulator AlpA
MTTYLRFNDLRERRIVNNRMTLSRWIKDQGFPPAVQLGPNSVAWPEDEIENWLAERERGSVAA